MKRLVRTPLQAVLILVALLLALHLLLPYLLRDYLNDKLADMGDRYVPFFEAARHTLTRQAVPMHFIPSEAKALLQMSGLGIQLMEGDSLAGAVSTQSPGPSNGAPALPAQANVRVWIK